MKIDATLGKIDATLEKTDASLEKIDASLEKIASQTRIKSKFSFTIIKYIKIFNYMWEGFFFGKALPHKEIRTFIYLS